MVAWPGPARAAAWGLSTAVPGPGVIATGLFWLGAFFGLGAIGCAALFALSRARAFLSARNLYAVLAVALLIGSAVLS